MVGLLDAVDAVGGVDRGAGLAVGLLDGLGGLAAGEFLDQVGDRGHPGGAADEDDVVDVALAEAGVLDGLLEGGTTAAQQVGGEFLELGPGERVVEVQRTGVRRGHERQADLGLLDLGQLDLGLFRLFR